MIIWRKVNSDISPRDISKTEDRLGITFPVKLYEIALNYNHGRPDKFVYDTERTKERVFGALLEFNSETNHSDNICTVYGIIKDRIPHGFYPFASDPAGNFICAHILDSKIVGIYLWLHEERESSSELLKYNTEFIANSLDEFLEKLYIPE